MPRPLGLAFVAALLFAPSAAWADAANCTRFRDSVASSSGDLRAQFVRPLIVTRGGSNGLDAYDLVSAARIDGVLRCRAEQFVSFEAKIAMPADDKLLDAFARTQEIALVNALGWAQGRARQATRGMAVQAAEDLRGSAERGDVAIAGKVESHLGDGVDLGLIYTNADRTFVVLTGQ